MHYFYGTVAVVTLTLVGTWREENGVNDLAARIGLVAVFVIMAAFAFS